MKKNCVGIDIAKSDFVAAITTSGKDHVKHFNRVLPLYNVGYITAGTPKSLTFSQN